MTEQSTNETADDAVPSPKKKPFVEPEISLPLEVLEATQFFLQTSGADAADSAVTD
jgi:hypothetical protein